MSTLVDRFLPDALWQRTQPLLPPAPARPRGGVPRRVPDRNCVGRADLHGPRLYPWSLLPAKELGCGGATTCGGGRLRIRSERSFGTLRRLGDAGLRDDLLQDAPQPLEPLDPGPSRSSAKRSSGRDVAYGLLAMFS
jgi:hypothetical protein